MDYLDRIVQGGRRSYGDSYSYGDRYAHGDSERNVVGDGDRIRNANCDCDCDRHADRRQRRPALAAEFCSKTFRMNEDSSEGNERSMMGDDSNIPAVAKRPSAVKRCRDERTRKRVRILRKSAPWLEERKYSILLARYAGLSVIFDRLVEDVRQHGLTNELGEPRAGPRRARFGQRAGRLAIRIAGRWQFGYWRH